MNDVEALTDDARLYHPVWVVAENVNSVRPALKRRVSVVML